MSKNFLILLLFFALVGGVIYFISTKDFTDPAMTFPEELDKDGCLGLTYHRVRNENLFYNIIGLATQAEESTKFSVYTEQFETQMKQLKEQGATFVTPDELREAKQTETFPEKCIWISFDDIDVSVYENAFPILKENNIPFTLFIIAGQVGKDYSNLEMASWEQLQTMINSGLATIGSHTFDMHYFSEDVPVFFLEGNYRDFQKDLQLSKDTIEEQLNVEVKDFAYPFGNGRADLVDAIKQSGYSSASILAPRSITSENDNYWMNRILVNQPVFDEIVQQWIN
ncbi:polysaccharide deacetylase family protein [Fredinandcohnia onubensis]|uniref:polysaccharide deacetylase family protein n=1 Tax=Fredinandcohnia onubensis TaxID=1571209 RepID=UPI000C0C075E|nr:polysaccharide deacetylase family protein [Fredinandcohnia onubensis]